VIKMACRADDIIARLGGDEFVVILPKTDALKAEQIIKRINDLSVKAQKSYMDVSIAFGYKTKSNTNEKIQDVFNNAEDMMYRNKLSQCSITKLKTVDVVMKTLFKKYNREQSHSIKVGEICEKIATKMDFNKHDVSQIKTAGLMHDIGKVDIDGNILKKPQKLNEDESAKIKRHPEKGYRILSLVDGFSEIAKYVLEHHERWDGTGYPRGLKGEDISLPARIIAVADSYDAMTSDRPYAKGLSKEEAINEIKRCSGTQFDPKIAALFVKLETK
jgi:putative nucleotidyltransferase with HDIG domain